MNKKVYLISGLGADERAFKKLIFPSDLEVVYLTWLPALPNETLEHYALRLSEKINTSIPFYLVGLSFGGMLATEIAKILNPIQTFIISSTPLFKELPWYFKVAGYLSLQKLVPVGLLKKGNRIGLRFLGAKTRDEKILLGQLVTDSDPHFIKWALSGILTWRNTDRPVNLIHIHGDADNILPLRFNKPDVIIKNGGHFMVYANADQISEVLLNELTKHPNIEQGHNIEQSERTKKKDI